MIDSPVHCLCNMDIIIVVERAVMVVVVGTDACAVVARVVVLGHAGLGHLLLRNPAGGVHVAAAGRLLAHALRFDGLAEDIGLLQLRVGLFLRAASHQVEDDQCTKNDNSAGDGDGNNRTRRQWRT